MLVVSRRWVVLAPVLLCLGFAWPADGQTKDHLVIGLTSFPSTMHPLVGGNGARNYIESAAWRAVTRYDGAGKLVCQLCTELPSVENGQVETVDMPDGSKGLNVTFTLRPGLRWGDGSPLTTRDLLFGAELEHVFAPRDGVIGVVAVDDRNYTVKLKAPRFDFQRLSPQPINAAIEEPIFHAAKDPLDYAAKSAFNRAPNTPGLWNGPYLLAGFKANESATFAPNPYWDGEKPAFDHVTMRLIDNTAALQANLLSGDIDIANGLTFDQVLDLQKRYADRFDVSFLPSLQTYWLYLQNENPMLADKRVRQAIMLGIDRDAIVDRVFDGKLPVASSFLPSIDPNYDADLKPWPYDPAQARTLLAQAGYTPSPDGVMTRADGTRLSLDLLVTSGVRTSELLQQVIQSQLAQIGIEAAARSEPGRVLYGQTLRKRLFKGMVMESYIGTPGVIPNSMFNSNYIPREANAYGGDNFFGYSNPRVDALLTSALVELNQPKRQALLNQVQALVMDDLPGIPLYEGDTTYVSPKWMTGLTPPQSTYVATLWIEVWRPR